MTLIPFDKAASLGLMALAAGAPALADAAAMLDPVIVHGDRSPQEPGSVSILGEEAIMAVSADHPAEILNTLPGVNIQMNAGQEHLIAIRSPVLTGGAGQGSFLILENGVPTRAAAFGNVNSLIEPHHEVARAIEVIRGPASARYGSNAVHGLVNVILPAPGRAVPLEIRAQASTLERYRGEVIASSDRLVAALSLQDEAGWRDDTGLQQQKLSLGATFDLAGWQASAWLSGSNLNQETAGFIEGFKAYRDKALAESNPNPEAYRDAASLRAALRLERDLGNARVVVTPYAITQAMDFRLHFLPYPAFEENGHDAFGVLSELGGTAGTLEWRAGIDGEIASGYLREVQDGPFGFFPGDQRFPEGPHYDYQVETSRAALWGEVTWALAGDLRLLAGLRGEAHHYDYSTQIPPMDTGRFKVVPDRQDDFDLFTPKLGMIWQPGDGAVSWYANYARGQRAPQASDLYRLQSNQQAGEISEETLDSIEIGARGTRGPLTFDIAAYWMEKENFFFRDADGLNVADGATRHVGIESAFDLTLMADTLSLSGTAAWSDQTYTFDRIVANGSEIIRDGNSIDTAPEWLADLTLIWTPTAAAELSLTADYTGAYAVNPANTDDYPGHTVFHARATLALDETTEAFVIVRNLFDLNYADRADFAFGDYRYFPGEPFNATLGVRKRFGG